ncbi:NAD-dependent epimerase/dehydratase family protein [Flavobacterium okayamense]|uniref:NAD-dependent epimerase n=1 Tax=Flavobacterium okayamense TaxID=2830782 RepID=A0ABM7S9L2_9FLAO|nr:NAD-dependent epimerase/dehydratase family protein [Flavobacterium okayamense]BCY28048.1 NAD-dependent epimerase [Flavobacterium okayamense]
MILVTGATGLVGSHLIVKLLQEKEEVKAIFRDKKSFTAVENIFRFYNADNLFEKINWIKADITDIPSLEEAFKGVTKVYHCAAFISFDPKDEDELMKVNLEGTANIVNCCLDFNIEKLCYVSSVAALGDPLDTQIIINEETEYNPEKLHSEYSISKYAAEMEVWRGFQEGLKVVIVNPGVIFGYGFPYNGSSTFIKAIKKGNPFYTKGKFGIIAVEDVVNCMITLMKHNINGERFTLVAENPTYEKILNLVAETLKVKKPFIYASKSFLSFAWRFDWFLSLIMRKKRILTKATSKALHSTKEFDNTKIKETLNYHFIEIDDYLKKLLKSF